MTISRSLRLSFVALSIFVLLLPSYFFAPFNGIINPAIHSFQALVFIFIARRSSTLALALTPIFALMFSLFPVYDYIDIVTSRPEVGFHMMRLALREVISSRFLWFVACICLLLLLRWSFMREDPVRQ